jgi:hypothetical protein
MTTVETMNRRGFGGLVVLFAGALVALSGCATIRAHEAASTERLLAAAGFQMRPADSPERLQDLATMPPFKVVSRSKDGNVVYTFADPENCHCLYVGGPKEYSAYERLRVEREIASEMNEASMNWDMWGPWWWR